MEPLYNIYFAGELLEGQVLQSVRENMARLFKADETTLNKLFSGTPQLLKRDCDKATALKYKLAMEKAGGRPIIKASVEAGTTAPPPEPEQRNQQSTAERIAALAAAPDVTPYPDSEPPQQRSTADDRGAVDGHPLDLEAPGTEVLRPEERAAPVVNDIDTGALDIDLSAQRLSEEAPPPPPAPDTAHLSMGEVGDSIPTLPPENEPVAPNTDGFDLAPEGSDFSDCNETEPDAPPVDLSQLAVAPAGSDVLEEKYRSKERPAAPATDHIALEDQG